MNRVAATFSFIVVAIAAAIVCISIYELVCMMGTKPTPPKVMAPTEADSPAAISRMVTVRFDGHLWIRSALSSGDWQPIHHPDCPCGKAR